VITARSRGDGLRNRGKGAVMKEAIRLIGRQLEDVREHITVLKSEVVEVEKRFEQILNDLAKLVERS
jgi:hypothetical protein